VADQKACLACVRKHLKPGGRFILDVFYPDVPRLIDPRYLMELAADPPVTLPDGRVLRRTERTAAFHMAAQYNDIELIHYVQWPDGREERLVHSFPMRHFYRYEIEHLLEICGFRITAFYGDYARRPFGDGSKEMVIVAEKAK
jgi:SAM-dependent methyltransferase